MILYLIKSALCSALFLAVYVLFLEREKMHRFNRWYLLCSIIISLVTPLINITQPAENTANLLEHMIILPASTLQNAVQQNMPALVPVKNNLPGALLLFYLTITVLFLIRFIKNILSISYKIKNSAKVPYFNSLLVLTNDKLIPHSFLHYVFIDRETYEQGKLEKEIMQHELTHVQQKHSLDILLLELLMVFCWCNPFLFLYRKAIKLNHEFLADDAVIKTFDNSTAYQYLLLKKAAQPATISLTSQFNYSITKKRLVMMTRTTSRNTIILKQLSALPVIAVAILIFSTTSTAQDTARPIQKTVKEVPSTIEGAPQQLLEEYAAIINSNKTPEGKMGPLFYNNVSTEERDRLEMIYFKMSKAQQEKQEVIFLSTYPPMAKAVPNKQQFAALKNAAVYGVWIDGKKVNNTILNKYSNTDFDHIFISKLYGGAKKNKSYTHQVNLMTHTYYQEYYSTSINDKKYNMVVRLQDKLPAKKLK